ncbi:hypothetical protein LTS09_001946 [Friedmanniomyces endolithicus]|nr:hypothetical protein LTS09_001946 [Friedmanniomyces endolithicus]
MALVLSFVTIYTRWQYYQRLRQFVDGPISGKQQLVESPQIPYTIPILGNTLAFLGPRPGQYWNQLFTGHPRSTGICTLLLGGRKTHILFGDVNYVISTPPFQNKWRSGIYCEASPSAVQALFKAKSPSRDVFDRDVFQKVFQLSNDQIHNLEAGRHHEVEMNSKYLTNFERVNELTAGLTKVLDEVLAKDSQEIEKFEDIGLYQWLRDRLFTASTRALFGDELLKMYPAYCEDFYAFDSDLLSFFFSLPSFMMGDAFRRRRRIIGELESWSKKMHELSGLNRARQLDYKTRNLTPRTGASLDLGLTFGLASNVIPATGWMLMHLLNPSADPSILPRILKELHEAELPDGTLDIPVLVSQPLLQSLWTETLRLYLDALVTRNLTEDLLLPLDEDGKRVVRLRKGENVFAPSWLGHHDPVTWSSPGKVAANEFDAERFVVRDAKIGRESFSVGGTAGKYFPFGGGRTVCPGSKFVLGRLICMAPYRKRILAYWYRVTTGIFAKQEALGALAMVLLRFDLEVLGFVDEKKKPTEAFPGLARAFVGSAVVVPGGDVRVKLRRKQMCR